MRRAAFFFFCVVVSLTAFAGRGDAGDGSECGEMPFWLPIATNGADVVALGEVEHVALASDGVFGTDMQTHVTIRVHTLLKGPPSVADELVFWTCYPAKKGELAQWSEPPLAAYGVGEEYLVFAEADSARKLYSRGTALEVSGTFARTPRDISQMQAGVPLACYIGWVDSLVWARSPESLSSLADVVAVLRVESVVGREDRSDADLERAEAVVLRSIKGTAEGASIAVALPARDRWDVPAVSPDDLILAFLTLREDGAFVVLGGRQGVYAIDEEAGFCRLSTRRSVIPSVPDKQRSGPTVLQDAVPLEELLRHVHEGILIDANSGELPGESR